VTEYQKKFITGSLFYRLDLAKWQWNHDETLQSILPEGYRGILKIQVLDSGCGMTPEAQSRLFQKFSQVNQAAGQRKVGTGLGLWICKELANRLDGDITTRSTVELGSVFELTIRTKVSQIPNKTHGFRPQLSQSRISSSTISSLDTRAPNNLSVLIADDDSFNIELMKNYLKKFGINYLCAYDGEEAVSLFRTHYREICFVITDNFMPKKTGTEAALEIASFLEEKNKPKIPILCISGDLKVNVSVKGITSVIQKPINFERLREELMVIYPQLKQTNDSLLI
jgi:CheY-like chemotaxis protein